jgi:Ca2+-transporting ATPase
MASSLSSYLHILDGRLRVKVPAVKRSVEQANRIESEIRKLEGVREVKANPATGNVLVHFDHQVLQHTHILDLLKEQGGFSAPAAAVATSGVAVGIAGRYLVQPLVEIALERLILALL